MFPGEGLLEQEARSPIQKRHQQLVKDLLLLGCKIGASPDGLLVHRTGSGSGIGKRDIIVEALEVKNHSPFARVSARDESASLKVIDRTPPLEVPPLYVGQLQLEMFCIGPHCRSAVFVRMTATRGASIMRVYRDDLYIEMMLIRIKKFYSSFVYSSVEPPEDFDMHHKDQFSVSKAVQMTLKVTRSAEIIASIPQSAVQRGLPEWQPLLY